MTKTEYKTNSPNLFSPKREVTSTLSLQCRSSHATARGKPSTLRGSYFRRTKCKVNRTTYRKKETWDPLNLRHIVAPVVAPELFLSADLGFVREAGLLGGSHMLARRWARTQERKQRQWSAIDVRLHTAHACGARDSHSKTPDYSQHERQDRLHWMRIRANEISHHSSVNISDHTIQFQNSAAPSNWKPGC